MVGMLTSEQLSMLTNPVNSAIVRRDDRGNSYLEQHEVRALLNRVFGYLRWAVEVLDTTLAFEENAASTKDPDKLVWTVTYRATVRLTIFDIQGERLARYEDCAVAGSQNMPNRVDAHDNSLKSAVSGALKRCAVNLGDQFGLSLYNDGSTSRYTAVNEQFTPGIVGLRYITRGAVDDEKPHGTALDDDKADHEAMTESQDHSTAAAEGQAHT